MPQLSAFFVASAVVACLFLAGLVAVGIITWNSNTNCTVPIPATGVYLSTFGNGVDQYLWLDLAAVTIIGNRRVVSADVVWMTSTLSLYPSVPLQFALPGPATEVSVSVISVTGFVLAAPANSFSGFQYSDTSIAFRLATDLTEIPGSYLTSSQVILNSPQRITFVVTYRALD